MWWGINDIRCLSISIFPSSAIWYLRDLTHLTICVLYCLNMYYANQRLNTIGLRLQFLVYALKNPNYFKCSKSSQCPSRYFRQKANLLLPMILLTQCLSDSVIFVSPMFWLSMFNIYVVIIKGFGKSSSLSLICKKGHYEHKIWDKMFFAPKIKFKTIVSFFWKSFFFLSSLFKFSWKKLDFHEWWLHGWKKKPKDHITFLGVIYSVLQFIYCKSPGDSWRYIYSPSSGTLWIFVW